MEQNFALYMNSNKRKCNGLNVTNVHVGYINTVVGYWKMQTPRSSFVIGIFNGC